MFVLGFQQKSSGSLAGFEPPASQIRDNINQPALPDLLQRTMHINSVTENSLRNKITVGRINKLTKMLVPKIKVR